MTLAKIPNHHHVVRHCRRQLTIRKDGQVVGVQPDLFHLRNDKGEKYLSAVYFEYFEGDENVKMKACLTALTYTPDGDSAMVRLNAGAVRECGKKFKQALRVVHDTKNSRIPSKAQINGMLSEPHVDLCSCLSRDSVVSIAKVSNLRSFVPISSQ